MATKEEYIKALNGMVEVYDNLDGCMSAINIFNEGVHLLTGLVNEHFEEKAETNYEHYKDGVIQSVKYNLAVVNGEPKLCGDINCDECDFKDSGECVKRVREWLNQQYKEPKFKLTQFEYDLLEQFLTSYKLKEITMIMKLKTKGYFNNINFDLTVGEVLDNCEVLKMEKRKRND